MRHEHPRRILSAEVRSIYVGEIDHRTDTSFCELSPASPSGGRWSASGCERPVHRLQMEGVLR